LKRKEKFKEKRKQTLIGGGEAGKLRERGVGETAMHKSQHG
jgi:hypothetical protein